MVYNKKRENYDARGVETVLKNVGKKTHYGRNLGQNLWFWANKKLVFGQHIPWVPNYGVCYLKKCILPFWDVQNAWFTTVNKAYYVSCIFHRAKL